MAGRLQSRMCVRRGRSESILQNTVVENWAFGHDAPEEDRIAIRAPADLHLLVGNDDNINSAIAM